MGGGPDGAWTPLSALDAPRFALSSGALYLALSAVAHPLSVLKTRAQHDAAAGPGAAAAGGAAALSPGASASRRSRLPPSAAALRSLYVGFWPATLGALPAEGAYLWALEGSREALLPVLRSALGDAGGAAAASFAAGALANVASLALYTPVEVAASRAFVAGGSRGSSFAAAARAVHRTHGLAGFYRGYWASLAAYAPGCAVWWAVYGLARDYAAWARAAGEEGGGAAAAAVAALPAWAPDACAGLAAGVLSAVATHPLDTVKTRMQTGAAGAGAGASWLAAARAAAASPGGGLWSGLRARVAELGPVSAVGAVGYEAVKRACLLPQPQQQPQQQQQQPQQQQQTGYGGGGGGEAAGGGAARVPD